MFILQLNNLVKSNSMKQVLKYQIKQHFDMGREIFGIKKMNP